MELTLGTKIITGVIFDRDYRSDYEIKKVKSELKKHNKLSHIHSRKEIENFVLNPKAIEKAITRRIKDRKKRVDDQIIFDENISSILNELTIPLKHKIVAQFISNRRNFEKSLQPSLDESTITENLMSEFEKLWNSLDTRLNMVPGKLVLSLLNKHLQENYQITITISKIIDGFNLKEMPREIRELIDSIDSFRQIEV